MAFSKIILNGDTLMDVTSDTVTAERLRSTYTATKADGTKITGSLGLASVTNTIDGGSLSPTHSENNVTAGGSIDSYNNGIYVRYGASKGELTCTTNATSAGYVDAGNLTVTTVPGSSASSYLYLQGVTLTTPSSGTSQFDITVPNGASTITFHFSVDSSGNVTIT